MPCFLAWHFFSVQYSMSICFSASVVTPDFALLPPSILNLVVLTILLAWLPGTQIFNKPVGVTNLYSTQKDSTATTYQDLRSIFKVRVC